MAAGHHVITDQQFFKQLFTWAQADKRDLDVAIGLGCGALGHAAQPDHRAGQVGNAHRIAHVQHKHLTAARHAAGLDHQLSGLRDQHEVANDVGVGDGDRPAGADLLLEQRHHRARRAQHIAKAHHREHGFGASALRRRLKNQLGRPLGRAHHIGGPHRLVGGDQHAGLNLQTQRGAGHGE